jgi:ankyrin repeat protein
VIKLLLDKDGVDLNSKNSKYSRTPLSKAAGNGHETVINLLLTKDGVHPNLKNVLNGQTPLS